MIRHLISSPQSFGEYQSSTDTGNIISQKSDEFQPLAGATKSFEFMKHIVDITKVQLSR